MLLLVGGIRDVWLVTLKQSSPRGLFLVRLTRSRGEAYASFVKECRVNQNGGFDSARQGKCYAHWAFNFIRLVMVGK